jgi:Uma2 family endonuclease
MPHTDPLLSHKVDDDPFLMRGPSSFTLHRLSVDDYHKMGEAGIFGHDDRVELIEGRLIDMAPIGSDHAGKVIQLNAMLNRIFSRLALVSPQNPIRLSEHSEPQPDFAILRLRDDFYRTSHPQPQDVLLVIEVSDTSVRYDREMKIPLYARYGIPEVWLLDLPNTQLEIYRQPKTEGYGEVLHPTNAEDVAPALLPDGVLSIADLWS